MVLVIGYGNSLRSDDGVGPYIVRQLEKEHLKGFECRVLHQLHVEILEEFFRYKKVVLVDASSDGPEISIRRIEPDRAGIASSHHLGPEVLAGLAWKIYGERSNLTVCTVRGECFDLGEKLSDRASARAEKILHYLKSMKDGE